MKDAVAEQVMEIGDQVLDTMVDGFRKFRENDRAEGDVTDMGALGGMTMMIEAAERYAPVTAEILLSLAIRRLVDAEYEKEQQR